MAHGWYGDMLWAAVLAGTLLTGLYTFRMYFLVFRGERSGYVREHFVQGHGEGSFSRTAPVAILAALALVGGWIQFAPFWHPVTTWLEPVARPLVEPRSWQEWTSSGIALALGLAGIWLAWLFYGARSRRPVPRIAQIERALQPKLDFDEA